MRKITSQSVLNLEADADNLVEGFASIRSSLARSERRPNHTPESIAAEDARTAERLRTLRLHLANAIAQVDALLAK
jgi:hypothetical protein